MPVAGRSLVSLFRLLAGVAVVGLLFASVPGMAQAPAAPDLQKVLAMLAEQQQLLASLQAKLTARLDEQQKVIDEQKKLIEELRTGRGPTPLLATVQPAVPAAAASASASASAQIPSPAISAPVSTAAALTPAPPPGPAKSTTPRWFEKYSLRGYTQLRHNRIFASNSGLMCESCDRNMGANTNLSLRRARLVLSGDITDRVAMYFQTDFASTAGNLHFGQIRDLYFDIALDKAKEWRIRAGQSKVPYGFENLQTSQNRLAPDRNDALNSAVPNERDLGAFLYWAPARIRTRLAALAASGLKGTGDYGVIGLGVMNGQSVNRPEANNDAHYVARAAYPWQLKSGRYMEAGIQAYTGKYSVTSDQRTATTLGANNFRYDDQRVAGSFIVYPQPFGFQAEYNIGRGPQYNAATRSIDTAPLNGGYAQTMYRRRLPNGQVLIPFARFQYYNGGKKIELDARKHLVRETEIGLEWQPSPYWELMGEFVHGDRTTTDGRLLNNRQRGNLFRLQLQVNY